MKVKSLVLALAIALGWIAAAFAEEGFDYTVASGKSVDQVVETITALAQADGFKVPGVHTLPWSDPYLLVELCDPAEARKVLAVDLRLGLLLPCGKIGVYKDARDSGKTKISMLLPANLGKLHPAGVIAAMAAALDPRMRKIVDAAK